MQQPAQTARHFFRSRPATPDALHVGFGNAKLSPQTATVSIPAGHFCPFARACLARADRATGRITDGPRQKFRCYAASTEMYPAVRENLWRNARLIRSALRKGGATAAAELILRSLPRWVRYCRFHVHGDFFSQAYFDAWMIAASAQPETLFYGYTKSLPYWARRLDRIPGNVALTASLGGSHDRLIERHGLRHCVVVFSEEEAAGLGLAVDHDDSLARDPRVGRFALLLHGSQPAGSEAAAARQRLKEKGWTGYGRT